MIANIIESNFKLITVENVNTVLIVDIDLDLIYQDYMVTKSLSSEFLIEYGWLKLESQEI